MIRSAWRQASRPLASCIMVRRVSLIIVAVLMASGCGSDQGPSDTATHSADSPVGSEPGPDAGSAPDVVADGTETTGEGTESDTDDGPVRPWAPTDLTTGAVSGDVASWTVEVLDVRPHDPSAFTQGFEIHEGTLYESTGLTGESTVRTVDIGSGEVISSLDVDADVFAEGLTIADGRIIQITFSAELAYVRDLDSLASIREFRYDGPGWGICYDGSRLVMSNGTPELAFRDLTTFDIVEAVEVRLNDEPLTLLNELECVDGYVFANVLKTNTIVVIDPSDGRVVATIDASELALDATGVRDEQRRVLNGIARLDETTFLLTGKEWPSMYRVRFVAT